jgi:hypothetical protein
MEELFSKLTVLLKALKESKPAQHSGFKIPPIKPNSPPPMSVPPAPIKPIASAPASKKDPQKIAAQIKDGSMSSKTQKVMAPGKVAKSETCTIAKNGQWSLN